MLNQAGYWSSSIDARPHRSSRAREINCLDQLLCADQDAVAKDSACQSRN